MATPETWGLKRTAKYLNYSVGYVREMASSGRIPEKAIIRIPGQSKYNFDSAEIKKWANPDGRRATQAARATR